MKAIPRLALLLGAGLASVAQAKALDKRQLTEVIHIIDDRQRNSGDYRSLAYLEQKEKDKTDTAREAIVYRRSTDQKLMILFTKPKGEAGKGYLRLDKNLWSYDPTTGKWERRTERERIAGTDSRRADFDESRLAEEYEAVFSGEAKLGAFDTWILDLKVKPGVDVAYPVVKLWVDQATSNVLKRQEFALSGRLMRTLYYPRWNKLFSESKGSDVWYPGEIRIYDEVEKANSTVVVLKSVDLRPLEANIFTKAWLESKSR
jgi:Outer membrane lipoprotein-sorting protein